MACFSSCFRTKILHEFLLWTVFAAKPNHLRFLDVITVKLVDLKLANYSHTQDEYSLLNWQKKIQATLVFSALKEDYVSHEAAG